MFQLWPRDSWFGVVVAGRDLSFLSELKPELPGEECGRVQTMQSCHLISAYCHYLFKTPSDTLAGAAFLGGKGKQRKKKKVEKYPRDCWRYCSDIPKAANSLGDGDITTPSNSVHPLHLQKSPNLSVLLLCDGLCLLIGSLTVVPPSQSRRIPQSNYC